MTIWVYVRSPAEGIYTTGFFDPSGDWHADMDFRTSEEAAERCHWLNGGYDDD